MMRSPKKSYSEAAVVSIGEAMNNSVTGEISGQGLHIVPKPLVIDFECSEIHRGLTPKILGEFLINELKLRNDEIECVGKGGGAKNTVKVFPKREIDVRERFGQNAEFTRKYGEVIWQCSVRGIKTIAPLKFLNVMYHFSDEELRASIRAFADPRSGMARDQFPGDTLLKGVWNGHKKVLVEVKGEIPEFVEIRGKKVWIQHSEQIRRCYGCGIRGHISTQCPRNKLDQEKENIHHDEIECPSTTDDLIAKQAQGKNIVNGTRRFSGDLRSTDSAKNNLVSYSIQEKACVSIAVNALSVSTEPIETIHHDESHRSTGMEDKPSKKTISTKGKHNMKTRSHVNES